MRRFASTMTALSALALALALTPLVLGATPNLTGQPCNIVNTRLAIDTNQLLSDCGYAAWCDNSTSTCKAIGCRKDEFPFGLGDRANWPAFCPQGQFCPDEAFGCIDVMPVGSPCQLSRDDQCQPPPSTDAGDKTLCLRNTCTYANATEGQTCINDNVVYTVYVSRISTYGDIVSRDNCRSGLYCDAPSLTCKRTLAVGQPCSGDKECASGVCKDSTYSGLDAESNAFTGVCASAFDKRAHAPAWVFILVTLGIVILVTLLCTSLSFVHRRNRRKAVQERKDYYAAQSGYRDDLSQIYEAAKSSYHLGNGGGSPLPASVQGSPRRSMSHTPLFTSNDGPNAAAAPNLGGATAAGYSSARQAPQDSSMQTKASDIFGVGPTNGPSTSRLSSMAYDVHPPSDDEEVYNREGGASHGGNALRVAGAGGGTESRAYYEGGVVSSYYNDVSIDEAGAAGGKKINSTLSSVSPVPSGAGDARAISTDSAALPGALAVQRDAYGAGGSASAGSSVGGSSSSSGGGGGSGSRSQAGERGRAGDIAEMGRSIDTSGSSANMRSSVSSGAAGASGRVRRK